MTGSNRGRSPPQPLAQSPSESNPAAAIQLPATRTAILNPGLRITTTWPLINADKAGCRWVSPK